MKTIINLVSCLVGIAFIGAGVYFGIWYMFIGGIVDIIDGAKTDPTSATDIATGVAKIIFFELPIVFGWIFGLMCFQSIEE